MSKDILTKIPLSGSTHGRGIKITQTAIATGDTIHTALATTVAGEGDEIFLDAYNSDAVAATITLGWGGTTDPDDLIKVVVPAGETRFLYAGFLRNALVVKAAASVANKVSIKGYVVRAE
jgi:hypothetical protein